MEEHSYGIEFYQGILIGSRFHEWEDCKLIYFYLPFIAFYYKIEQL